MHVRPVRERVFLLIPKFANPARYLQPNILKISRVYICQNTYSTNKVRALFAFVLSPKDSSREFFNIFPLLLSCPVCCKSLSSPRKIILSERVKRLIRNKRINKNLLLRSLIFLFFLFFDWREDQTEKRQKPASFSCPSILKNRRWKKRSSILFLREVKLSIRYIPIRGRCTAKFLDSRVLLLPREQRWEPGLWRSGDE